MFNRTLLLFLVCLLASTVLAQQHEKQYQIPAHWYAGNSNAVHNHVEHSTRVGRLSTGTKFSDLSKFGILVDRVLDNKWIVFHTTSGQESTVLKFFTEIRSINNYWKVSDKATETDYDSYHNFIIGFKHAPDIDSLNAVTGLHFRQVSQTLALVRSSRHNVIPRLIDIDEIIYIGLESLDPTPDARVIDLNPVPNAVNLVRHYFPALTGQGQVLSVKELAFDAADIDLSGRALVSGLEDARIDNHATEMATIAAGAGHSFVTGRGVAPAASITSSSYATLVPDDDASYETLAIGVQNHSYGTAIENFYGAFAEAYDNHVLNNPQVLHVFSSGNEGMTTSTNGPYAGVAGYANLTGNFKMAKNVLTVGCVDTVNRAMSFSSRGPAFDGRIKPDIVAYSTQGSSNAAALVSGIGVLLQQAYRDQFGTLPEAALLRALLINNTDAADAPEPDHITGFGSVNAYNSLLALQQQRFASAAVGQDEVHEIVLPVPANAARLSVTLAWTDVPAAVNSARALVNDLDITITDPDGNAWMPWGLHTEANAQLLAMPATRKPDHLNNVEKISLDALTPGSYTLRVHGYDVSSASQNFFLTWSVDTLDQFQWLHPTGSDNLPYDGETTEYLRWKSTLGEAEGQLQYTVDNGLHWENIHNSVSLHTGRFRWHAPDTFALAQVRMVVGNNVFASDQFTLSRPLALRVGFDCDDSLMLQWNKVPAIKNFDVATLNNNELVPLVTNGADSSIVIIKATLSGNTFMLRPYFDGGKPAIQSYAVNYTTQGAGCFLRTFTALAQPPDGIVLSASLGTTYAVEQVTFERFDGVTYTPIGTAQPAQTTVSFVDASPREGLNLHRVRLTLSKGATILSEEVANLYLRKLPYLLFPNPVTANEPLGIVVRDAGASDTLVELYNRDGSRVFSQYLLSGEEYVTLRNVTPGLYLFAITTSKGTHRGKLVVVR